MPALYILNTSSLRTVWRGQFYRLSYGTFHFPFRYTNISNIISFVDVGFFAYLSCDNLPSTLDSFGKSDAIDGVNLRVKGRIQFDFTFHYAELVKRRGVESTP